MRKYSMLIMAIPDNGL